MSRIVPILFNTDMVRAILDGRKTVTRRVVKLPSYVQKQEDGLYTLFADGTCYENLQMEEMEMYLPSPCRKGDILYVRETWHKYIKRVGNGKNCRLQEFYGYKAGISNSEDANEKWKPSIHMPKEAARIFLKVTDVRLERLQDMNLDDFLAEGVCLLPEAFNDPENAYLQVKRIFSNDIWDSTLKKSDLDRYGWKGNPYVWVIEFERCEKPKEKDDK